MDDERSSADPVHAPPREGAAAPVASEPRTREALRSNVELKARLDDAARTEAVALAIGVVDAGRIEQTDTYFSLGRQRLKLRESSDGAHCLIGYARADHPEPRMSQYRLTTVSNPGALKATLARQWGVKVVVKKTRRLFLWNDRVRIHVDRVEGLGEFLEFEAVLDPVLRPDYDECAALLDVTRLAHDFELAPRDLVAESYGTLVARAAGEPGST